MYFASAVVIRKTVRRWNMLNKLFKSKYVGVVISDKIQAYEENKGMILDENITKIISLDNDNLINVPIKETEVLAKIDELLSKIPNDISDRFRQVKEKEE
jgi:hypothetical protein